MPDAPEKLPELVAKLRMGSVASGECSFRHQVIVVRGVGVETPERLAYMLKQTFLEHVCDEHFPRFITD